MNNDISLCCEDSEEKQDEVLTEFILDHDGLAKQKIRAEELSDVKSFFKMDYRNGTLESYKGTFVLYWKGILCGQSANAERLLKKAQNYYGRSNLLLFEVPKKESQLDRVIVDAYARLI